MREISIVLFPHFAAKGLRVNACFPCLRHFHHTALIELVAAQSLVTVHPRNEDEIIEVVGILFELLIVRQPQGCFLDSQQLFKLMVGQIGEFLCQHCQIIHMGIHGESEPEPRHIRHIIIKENISGVAEAGSPISVKAAAISSAFAGK